mmetsp:Transcript_37008/g.92085  ORF Transcript_37008/g.92085 Transcript_37008/m.92085 type:complete len:218 (-) Transcript_37008:1072-1725(-)
MGTDGGIEEMSEVSRHSTPSMSLIRPSGCWLKLTNESCSALSCSLMLGLAAHEPPGTCSLHAPSIPSTRCTLEWISSQPEGRHASRPTIQLSLPVGEYRYSLRCSPSPPLSSCGEWPLYCRYTGLPSHCIEVFLYTPCVCCWWCEPEMYRQSSAPPQCARARMLSARTQPWPLYSCHGPDAPAWMCAADSALLRTSIHPLARHGSAPTSHEFRLAGE